MKPDSIKRAAIGGLMIGLLAGLVPGVQAGQKPKEETGPVKLQQQTPAKAWLEMQSSGKAASPHPQPLSGPAMNRVHERYLKSFTHPVPPYFEHAQPSGY